jgi:hypothetical protein
MQFFGEDIANADNIENKPQKGPRNLLELLPDEFSDQDAISVRRQQGMDSKGWKQMVRTWKNRNYIKQQTANSYQKLKFKN